MVRGLVGMVRGHRHISSDTMERGLLDFLGVYGELEKVMLGGVVSAGSKVTDAYPMPYCGRA